MLEHFCVLRSAFCVEILRVRLQRSAFAQRDAFADCQAGSLGSLDFATVLGRVNDAFAALRRRSAKPPRLLRNH